LLDLIDEKGQHHEQDKDFTQVFLAKTKIVLEVIVLGFQDIEGFSLDRPSGASASHKMKNIVLVDGQIGIPDKMLRLAGLTVFFPLLHKGDLFLPMDLF
jgi:hypothetical protein